MSTVTGRHPIVRGDETRRTRWYLRACVRCGGDVYEDLGEVPTCLCCGREQNMVDAYYWRRRRRMNNNAYQ